ncbi:NADPH-dependent F420 reductase [Aquihabitans sp. G128]|uniref:NADPH-dependent F420 reductase n=1 Tax=Aquihabitans sp. G128 TaxID=2849779 RepID=UPI001C235449|nr:NADPH-dependent F420 reductase [Aquihabitans sp. G128]QXC61819.1 NADPH-dependent F420 reductase [Aquihabitans sp. G128]
MQIGILGGTGPAGSALAARLASVGHEAIIGSRSKYRAMEVVDKLQAEWKGRKLNIVAGDNAMAAAAEVVVIATPWDGAYGTATSVADLLEGKVVICMANALTRTGKEFQPLVPPRGSVAATVQAAVPKCHVAAGFHHVPAKELGDLDHPIESDVLICSDFPHATEVTAGIVASVGNLRPLDAGGLSQATPIESFTAVLLQLNVHYKTRVAVKFTGIPELAPNSAEPARKAKPAAPAKADEPAEEGA